MHPAYISIRDQVVEVVGLYQHEEEPAGRPRISLHLDTAAGVDVVFNFHDLSDVERFQARVIEAVRKLRQQAGNNGREP